MKRLFRLFQDNARGLTDRLGYPPYALSNLSANIRRDEKRLVGLQEVLNEE